MKKEENNAKKCAHIQKRLKLHKKLVCLVLIGLFAPPVLTAFWPDLKKHIFSATAPSHSSSGPPHPHTIYPYVEFRSFIYVNNLYNIITRTLYSFFLVKRAECIYIAKIKRRRLWPPFRLKIKLILEILVQSRLNTKKATKLYWISANLKADHFNYIPSK